MGAAINNTSLDYSQLLYMFDELVTWTAENYVAINHKTVVMHITTSNTLVSPPIFHIGQLQVVDPTYLKKKEKKPHLYLIHFVDSPLWISSLVHLAKHHSTTADREGAENSTQNEPWSLVHHLRRWCQREELLRKRFGEKLIWHPRHWSFLTPSPACPFEKLSQAQHSQTHPNQNQQI